MIFALMSFSPLFITLPLVVLFAVLAVLLIVCYFENREP